MFSKRDGIASKTELPDQNVDKSGKIVDNRPKMCKSAFKNFLPVLPEACVVQVLPVRRVYLVDVGQHVKRRRSYPQFRWISFPHFPHSKRHMSSYALLVWISFPHH